MVVFGTDFFLVRPRRKMFPVNYVAREMEMEMDSHGGLEVTIRQTEWKKKLPNNFVAQTSECS